MTLIGIRELETNADELVRRVREKGETIDITYHGQVVARLVPVADAPAGHEELATLWAEMDHLAQEVAAQWTGSPSAVEAVSEGRD